MGTISNNVSRRRFSGQMAVGATGTMLHGLLSGGSVQGAEKAPNVLVVQPDQHRGNVMRCAGDRQVDTPNLDRLAGDGIRFSNCVSNSPVCSPFRGTIQTGLYPHTHGVVNNNILLDPNLTTFAEIFEQAGYATGYIGKWHLDGGVPPKVGGYIEAGERRQGWQEWNGYEKSHEYFDVWKFNDRKEQVPVDGYNWEPTWHTDMALDFAGRHTAAGKPWCYYLAYGPPHLPQQCPKEFMDMYDPAGFTLPPDLVGKYSPEIEKIVRDIYQVYYGQVTAIDYEIGRLMAGLEKLGVADNTIILYTSDHGDLLGSHFPADNPKKQRGKAAPYIKAFDIPLIVHWPEKIKPRQVCDLLTSGIDLAPTILELAGLHVPANMQGDSMAGWCMNGNGPRHDSVYLGIGGPPKKGGWRAVWDGRYVYAPVGYSHLYDHKQDPDEMNNLFDSSANEKVRKQMGEQLVGFAETTGDPMLDDVKKACT